MCHNASSKKNGGIARKKKRIYLVKLIWMKFPVQVGRKNFIIPQQKDKKKLKQQLIKDN